MRLHTPHSSELHSIISKAALSALGASGIFHVLPSALALGTWSGVVRLPWGMCTWRGSGGVTSAQPIASLDFAGSTQAGNTGVNGMQSNGALTNGAWANGTQNTGIQAGRIAITFDDGPDPKSTIPVLDRLDYLGIRATFFCLGAMMASYPDVVQEIAHRGHEIGIHGYNHVAHLLRPPWWIWQDVARAKQQVEEALDQHGIDYPDKVDRLDNLGHVRWFRPPKGVITGTTLMAAKYYGLDIVLWSAWGKEWTTSDPMQVASRVIHRLSDGLIVLLHDADTTSPPGTWEVAYEALPRIVEEAHNRNLQPVTLSELLGSNSRVGNL